MFVDRRHAGKLLAQLLERFAPERPIVLALPRGGVAVAVEVARSLHAPLEVLAVRKLGAPGNPELAVGAIAEDGTVIVDRFSARRVGMTQQILNATVERETRELQRRVAQYRGGRPLVDIHGRTVIIVDDGLATGMTELAAARAARSLGAVKVVVAVPVGARESVARVAAEADEIVCHTVPRDLLGVSCWYEDFAPLSDDDVLRLLAAPRHPGNPSASDPPERRDVLLETLEVTLGADLTLPAQASGLVIFAHGSGSSRRSPRNRAVAQSLAEAGFATLLLDLLTDGEARRRELAFDIELLAQRLEVATLWAAEEPATCELPLGYFGASTGAAAALRAAASVGDTVRAVVSRGGRPDLAAEWLGAVTAPTLLIVGGLDTEVLRRNREAAELLHAPHRLVVVENASHLFGEPGKLEIVEALARDWFAACLRSARLLVSTGGD